MITPPDNRPTLLIADDDPVVRAVLSVQLEPHFRLIAPARDAAEATALAEEHQPDAALIDVEMPGGGAREAVPAIAGCSPNTCMVILSGDERHDVVPDLLSAGATAYMRKGSTGREIAKALTHALGAIYHESARRVGRPAADTHAEERRHGAPTATALPLGA